MSNIDFSLMHGQFSIVNGHKGTTYSFDPDDIRIASQPLSRYVRERKGIFVPNHYVNESDNPVVHVNAFLEHLFEQYESGFVPKLYRELRYRFGSNKPYTSFNMPDFEHERERYNSSIYSNLVTVPESMQPLLKKAFKAELTKLNNYSIHGLNLPELHPHFIVTLQLPSVDAANDFFFMGSTFQRFRLSAFSKIHLPQDFFPFVLSFVYHPGINQYCLYFSNKRLRNFFVLDTGYTRLPVANLSIPTISHIPLFITPPKRS